MTEYIVKKKVRHYYDGMELIYTEQYSDGSILLHYYLEDNYNEVIFAVVTVTQEELDEVLNNKKPIIEWFKGKPIRKYVERTTLVELSEIRDCLPDDDTYWTKK